MCISPLSITSPCYSQTALLALPEALMRRIALISQALAEVCDAEDIALEEYQMRYGAIPTLEEKEKIVAEARDSAELRKDILIEELQQILHALTEQEKKMVLDRYFTGTMPEKS